MEYIPSWLGKNTDRVWGWLVTMYQHPEMELGYKVLSLNLVT